MNRPCGSVWRARPEARAIKSQGDAGLPRQENAPLVRRVFDAKGPRPRDCLIARAREGGFSLSDLAPSRRAELCVFRRAASGLLPRLAPYAALPRASVFSLSPPKRNGFARFEGAPSHFALPLAGSRKLHGQHLHAQSHHSLPAEQLDPTGSSERMTGGV